MQLEASRGRQEVKLSKQSITHLNAKTANYQTPSFFFQVKKCANLIYTTIHTCHSKEILQTAFFVLQPVFNLVRDDAYIGLLLIK